VDQWREGIEMASIAQAVPGLNGRLTWLWEFLKEELAPYQGRAALVTRMVVASSLVMIISMTFRLPYGAYGAIYALILSRTSLEATASAVRMIFIGFLLAGAYIILGLMVALADPILRFVWITTGFFVGFWAMSALSNYAASGRFGYLIAITVALWDSHISPAQKVENALWAVGVITLASMITLLLEIAFAAFRRSDDLIDGMAERLTCVEALLRQYATGEAAAASIRTTLARLAMTGTSRMRLILRRSGFDPQYAAEMGAVVALTGRLVDLAANLPYFSGRVPESDRERIGRVANHIREIRDAVTGGSVSQLHEFAGEGETPFTVPLFAEIEQTVSLIPQAFAGSRFLRVFTPSPDPDAGRVKTYVSRKLLDPEHIKFGLRGCFAATSCYVIFNALFWPEISTAVTTFFVTALTTIGASRQKQVLRFAGALVGGFGIGFGAQIFVLPYIDSIAGFTVLYIAVMTVAAWIATSSPRLSYFGVQLAVAFCLINLLEFKFQTSLTVARDRVVGILLGLFMMWLFFDHLWSTPAGLEMKRTFVSALRMLAQLARGPLSTDLRNAIEDSYVLRDEINAKFDGLRSLADGVLFEFGPSRTSDLEFRARIRRWQPQLRALFLMRIALFKYRLQAPGFELPDTVRLRQEAYDDASARTLEEMADRIENPIPGNQGGAEPRDELKRRLHEAEAAASRELQHAQAQSFLTLLHGIDALTDSLAAEIATEVPRSVLRG
jgi:multidrug resistance protein MdtO